MSPAAGKPRGGVMAQKEKTMDLEMYNTVCKTEFAEIKDSIGELSEDIKSLRKVMLGNGKVGITTMIAQNKKDIDVLTKVTAWSISIASALLTALLIGGAWGIINHVQGK